MKQFGSYILTLQVKNELLILDVFEEICSRHNNIMSILNFAMFFFSLYRATIITAYQLKS